METRTDTPAPVRSRGRGRRRPTVHVPLWATATISTLALWIGVGIGLAVTSTPTPCPTPQAIAVPLPGTPTGTPITPMNLGDTILLGDKTGIAFTAAQVADPATAEPSMPSLKYRYLAVKLTISNTTNSTWKGDGVPTVHSVAIGSDGHQYGTVAASTTLAPPFAANLTLPAGGAATGAVTFQVPATATVSGVQTALTPDGGVVGLWTIN